MWRAHARSRSPDDPSMYDIFISSASFKVDRRDMDKEEMESKTREKRRRGRNVDTIVVARTVRCLIARRSCRPRVMCINVELNW